MLGTTSAARGAALRPKAWPTAGQAGMATAAERRRPLPAGRRRSQATLDRPSVGADGSPQATPSESLHCYQYCLVI